MDGRKILFLICCFFLATSAWSQVLLNGVVTHEGKSLEGVTIQVYENGKALRTLEANRRGKYEIEIPLNHTYMLVFRRAYMIPVRIAVNTTVYQKVSEDKLIIDLPLNMELFHYYKGMDVKAYREPMGEVRNAGGELADFEFFRDQERIALMKEVNEESRRRERKGESPITPNDQEGAELTTTVQVSNTKEPEPEHNQEAESRPEPQESDIAVAKNAEEEANEVRMDREVENYDRIEAAETERANNERAMQQRSQHTATDKRNQQENYIATSKSIRSKAERDREQSQREAVDARVIKQQELERDMEEAASKARLADHMRANELTRGLKRTHASGWFYEEEKLQVCEEGVEHDYRKVIYSWLLFDVEYYYKNDSEITKDVYEVARRLFD